MRVIYTIPLLLAALTSASFAPAKFKNGLDMERFASVESGDFVKTHAMGKTCMNKKGSTALKTKKACEKACAALPACPAYVFYQDAITRGGQGPANCWICSGTESRNSAAPSAGSQMYIRSAGPMKDLAKPDPAALPAGAGAEAGTEAGWLKIQESVLAHQKAEVKTMTASVTKMGQLTAADAAKIAGMNGKLSGLKAKADASVKADKAAKDQGNMLATRATANIEVLRSMLIDKLGLSAQKAAAFQATFTDASNLLEKVQMLANQCTSAELTFMQLSKEVVDQQGKITLLSTSLTSQIAAFEASKAVLGSATTALSGAEADQAAADTALAGAEAKKATATADNADAASANDAAKTANTAAMADNDAAKTANSDANAANTDAAGKLAGAETANSAANTANTDATAGLATATTANGQAGAEAKIAADSLAKSIAALSDVEARKADALAALAASIDSRTAILKATIASKHSQMELLQSLQTELRSTMEDMRVMIQQVRTSIATMESMNMMDIFAPKTTIGGSGDCASHEDTSITNPPGYCVKPGRSIKSKAALTADLNANVCAVGTALRRQRRLPFWKKAFVAEPNQWEMWSGLTTAENCWNPEFAERSNCDSYGQDPYYVKAPTPPSTQMAFRVTGECVSPYSTTNDYVQIGAQAAGAVDGRLKDIGMSKAEMKKVAANMQRILGNQGQQMTKSGDDTDAEALKGTCYDRRLMASLQQAVSGFQSVVASASDVDAQIAKAKAGGEAVDAAVAGAEAVKTSLRFREAADPASAEADPKPIVEAICKDAGSLAALITAAGDRTAAMVTYINEVSKIISSTKEIQVTLTTRLDAFEGYNQMISDYRTANKKKIAACSALEIKLGDMLGANEAAIAAAKKKTDEANAAAAAANAGAATATGAANALNADTASKVADTTALDGKTAKADADTTALNGKTATTNADTAGKVADTTALDGKTATTNADTAGKVADTTALDTSTAGLNAQASSDTSGAASNDAAAVSKKAEIEQTMAKIGKLKAAIATLQSVSTSLATTMSDAQEQYTWLKEDFEGVSQQFGPFIQIFKFCDKLKCYDSCRAAPDKWPVLGTCDGQKALQTLSGAAGGSDSSPPVHDPNGGEEIKLPEAIFRLNAFGCTDDNVDWYNPKPVSWTKPCIESSNLYECMDPKYVDTFKAEIKTFAVGVLEIANTYKNKIPVNLLIKGYFAGGAGNVASDGMQKMSQCRAELMKKIIEAEAKLAFGNKLARSATSLPKFDWICVTASKTTAAQAKTTGVVATIDKKICKGMSKL